MEVVPWIHEYNLWPGMWCLIKRREIERNTMVRESKDEFEQAITSFSPFPRTSVAGLWPGSMGNSWLVFDQEG
jgi:hypothetical protein